MTRQSVGNSPDLTLCQALSEPPAKPEKYSSHCTSHLHERTATWAALLLSGEERLDTWELSEVVDLVMQIESRCEDLSGWTSEVLLPRRRELQVAAALLDRVVRFTEQMLQSGELTTEASDFPPEAGL